MDDIATFLRARYAEERQREMSKRRHLPDAPPNTLVHTAFGDDHVLIGYDDEPTRPRMTVEEFDAQYTEPAPNPFVLADLDAKEQILRELPGLGWHEPCASLISVVAALMAQPYANHPAHKEEWRP